MTGCEFCGETGLRYLLAPDVAFLDEGEKVAPLTNFTVHEFIACEQHKMIVKLRHIRLHNPRGWARLMYLDGVRA